MDWKESNQLLKVDLVNDMNIFINKLVVNGAKNIDKPIELFFSNKTIKSDIDFSNSNVKAIYGPNGSGKSAIMAAMYIYKRVLDDVNGINDSFFSHFIYETINKEFELLSIEVIFTLINDKIRCYKHKIEFGLIDEIVVIKREEISILKDKTIKDENFKNLILIENGQIKYLKSENNDNLFSEPLYRLSLNLLDKNSIVSMIYRLLFNNLKYIGDKEVIKSLSDIVYLSHNLIVELNKEDIHLEYISNQIRDKNKSFKSLKEVKSNDYLINLSTINRDVVKKYYFSKYEDNIRKLEEFIKIFKPDLDKIVIDKKDDDDKYYCDKIFIYGKKRINVEFESTGIKKLVRLYSALKSCANGRIVFIDEMDANLHDVYFTKLIEFFKNDSKGQLCFTTHNLEPIDILKDKAHSLDFISNDSRVCSWIKDGNRSPMNKYVNGLIPYSPFNIESFDFDLLLDEE